MKKYEKVVVYFDTTNKAQRNLFNKLRELTFRKKIQSSSSFLRQTAYQHLINKGLIK